MDRCGITMNSNLEKSLQLIDPDRFRPFGQVIYPQRDDKPWDENDANLDLSQGIPRVYIMTLKNQGLTFNKITQHRRCTQCLAAIGGGEWFLGVARPEIAPDRLLATDVFVFRIKGHCLLKLEKGTWHAGPYFVAEAMDFFNLELTDTNITDHHCVELDRSITFALE